jgi:hypothetical protein
MTLRDALQRILSPRPSPTDAEPFITVALRMATLHLRNKTGSGSITPAFFGLTLEDLAVDCVGPLFERDGLGRFVQLREYYISLNWETLDDAELLAYTRRLVFNKVNQQIARLYKESDPSLEKLMRNLRNAMRSGTHLVEQRRANELWVTVPKNVQHDETLPLMPWEFLEGEIIPRIQAKTTLKDIVRNVADILSGQNTYRQSYPFTSIALIIRTAFVRAGEAVENDGNSETSGLSSGEIRNAIERTVAGVATSKEHSYVTKGKVTSETYTAYINAARAILLAEFVENDGHEKSFYQQLAGEMPGLVIMDYRKYHRCHFEYLVKLSREQFVRFAREEL